MSDPCRPKAPTPPDPAIRPGDIRDRAMRAVLARGPVPEDPEKTRASQEYWRQFREGQKLLARAEHESARLGRPPAGEVVINKTSLPNHLVMVTTNITDPHRLQPFETFVMDESTGEVMDLVCFATVAAALMHHDRMVRAALKEAALRHRSRGIARAPRTRGVGQSRRNQ